MSARSHLQRAIEFAGSICALADALGVDEKTIRIQLTKDKIDATLAIEIERVTLGYVKRYELRPDIWILEDGTRTRLRAQSAPAR